MVVWPAYNGIMKYSEHLPWNFANFVFEKSVCPDEILIFQLIRIRKIYKVP
jgi:hypothetical protein